MTLIAIPLLGLFVSIVSVFIGLGGGILLVPLLPSIFGLTVKEAVATSLLTIVFVVSDNTKKFNSQKLVKWPVVWLMGPLSAIGAVVAAQVAQRVEPEIILWALVSLLILVVIRTGLSSLVKRDYIVRSSLGTKEKGIAIGGGLLAGLTSGFAGVGAGVILSPVMIVLRLIKPEELSPTANANMMFSTIAATLSFAASGSLVKWNQWGLIRWDIALGLFVSASFFSHFLRPHQNKLPFKAKTLLLLALLSFLILKILKGLL